MPESFKASVSAGRNRDSRDRPKKRFEKRISIQSLIAWINNQHYEEYVKQELIRSASMCPYTGLKYFVENINAKIIKITEQRKERDDRERMSATAAANEQPIIPSTIG